MAEIISFSELQKKMQIDKKGKKEIKFKYRNAEDIYNKFKKIDSDWELIASDELFEICGRLFVKSTVTVQRLVNDILEKRDATAFSELDNVPVYKNGNQQMQIPQWTGAVSSYARKYALQGLFAIGEDDVDDLSNEIENTQQNNQYNNQPHQQPTQMSAPNNNQQSQQEPLIDNFQLDVINKKIKLLAELKNVHIEQISSFVLGKFKINNFSQVPISGYDLVINYLEGQIKKTQPQ
ncbi:TPA: ERF family protein [Streptococcus agalactiae]|uniref:ERF family protein n=1 Tax=Streptococcus agalactiae TaxID=1311 RepID=UPI000D703487|nr:ERF family protein [Streptococcus agalactiae]PWT25379.1 single-stranded DNA-binding protein [Streptococcus agalactiae]HEN3143885.1 ERF family protein [Streptococcus agalactiae]